MRESARPGRLGLLDWVYGMPGGLDAELAAGGGGLSAGEAPLLAFTRVLLRIPGLVILDEAASRLDPVTEARLAGPSRACWATQGRRNADRHDRRPSAAHGSTRQ